MSIARQNVLIEFLVLAALIVAQQLVSLPARADECPNIFRQMEAEQKRCDDFRRSPRYGAEAPRSWRESSFAREKEEDAWRRAKNARDDMVDKNCNLWQRKDLPECVTLNRAVAALEAEAMAVSRAEQEAEIRDYKRRQLREAEFCGTLANLRAEWERECVHTARRAPRARSTRTVPTDTMKEDEGIVVTPAMPAWRPESTRRPRVTPVPTYQPRTKGPTIQTRTKGPSISTKGTPIIRTTPQRTTVVRTVPRTTVIRTVPRTTVIRTAPRAPVIRTVPRQRCHMKAGRLHCGAG